LTDTNIVQVVKDESRSETGDRKPSGVALSTSSSSAFWHKERALKRRPVELGARERISPFFKGWLTNDRVAKYGTCSTREPVDGAWMTREMLETASVVGIGIVAM
jgi:hypothetical protein